VIYYVDELYTVKDLGNNTSPWIKLSLYIKQDSIWKMHYADAHTTVSRYSKKIECFKSMF
jgi:hypothetical protein